MEVARHHILQRYQIAPDALIQKGMEAEVYAYGPDTVLKLYRGISRLVDLRTLQDFYKTLDRQCVPYALPQIDLVAQEAECCVTIEKRLPGLPMSDVLPSVTDSQLDAMMERYLTAALALSTIPVPALDRYKLFDAEQISHRSDGDWNAFLSRYLTHKLAEVGPFLHHDVPQLDGKIEQLRTILSQPYGGNEYIIHGDYFPGNLLIDTNHEITALLDFGLLTMVGDPLFDLATGWVFFDMYDELKARIRERYLAILLDRLGEHVRGTLYHYVLFYSIISANTYSSTCNDGHYQWCVANLLNRHYWQALA